MVRCSNHCTTEPLRDYNLISSKCLVTHYCKTPTSKMCLQYTHTTHRQIDYDVTAPVDVFRQCSGVCVCACARVRVCACARVRVCACARVRVCACARVRVCACARVRVCACARVRVCACARVRVCACVRVRVCTCAYACQHIKFCMQQLTRWSNKIIPERYLMDYTPQAISYNCVSSE